MVEASLLSRPSPLRREAVNPFTLRAGLLVEHVTMPENETDSQRGARSIGGGGGSHIAISWPFIKGMVRFTYTIPYTNDRLSNGFGSLGNPTHAVSTHPTSPASPAGDALLHAS
jgi:hypothetical protein